MSTGTVKCEWRSGDVCTLASRIARLLAIAVTDGVCCTCCETSYPMQPNHVVANLVIKATAGDPKRRVRAEKRLRVLLYHAPKGLGSRVRRYIRAVSKWQAAGRPVRTDAQVQVIMVICNACDQFDEKRCLLCGCRMNRGRSALFNKARMATEHCPKKKW